jgi:hypothetical protein
MTLRNSKPMSWAPLGLSDSVDATAGFPGCMLSLSNLIPAPQGRGLWICRPASIKSSSFSGYTSPGFVSAIKVIGTKVYGMVASGRNPGKDEPFIYDAVSGLFTTISGITSANTPASPSTSGDWTPPTLDQIGSKIIFTHPGFNTGGGYFIGVLDISNPSFPAWSAGNLTGGLISFTTLPVAVQQFNGRAWYAVGDAIIFSDTTNPINCTFGTQVLILGFNVPIVALVGLPLSALTGGIIQSLMAFVDGSYIYQVVGDAASIANPLSLNQLNVATGTPSQNSVCATPVGLCFISSEGLRFVDFTATISEPLGSDGQGVSQPFFFALFPTRMQLAYAGDVIRVTLQNGLVSGSPFQEYFYHLSKKRWSGPHTFPASMIDGYGSSFIMSPVGVLGSLWQSNITPGITNTYVENGAQLQFSFSSPLVPDTSDMDMHSIIEQTINLQPNLMDLYVFAVLNEQGTILGLTQVQGTGVPTIWGGFNWGSANWAGNAQNFATFQLGYPTPLVFKRMFFQGSGPSSAGFMLGKSDIRVEALGYLLGGNSMAINLNVVILAGTFTIAPNATSTNVSYPLCTPASTIIAQAITDDARVNPVEIVPGSGSFLVKHGANPSITQTYAFLAKI